MLLLNAAINYRLLGTCLLKRLKPHRRKNKAAGSYGLELGGMIEVHRFLENQVRIDLLFST